MKTEAEQLREGLDVLIAGADDSVDMDARVVPVLDLKDLLGEVPVEGFDDRRTRDDVAWDRGFIVACCNIHKLAGHTSVIQEALRDAGITLERLDASGVSAYDAREVRPLCRRHAIKAAKKGAVRR